MPNVSIASRFTAGRSQLLFMLVTVWMPALHVAIVVGAAYGTWRLTGTLVAAFAAALVSLYLLPPLVVRIAVGRTLDDGLHHPSSSAFRRWWLASQAQGLFNRLPMLEECLRLIPGLYSTWLRLWGSRIGGRVFWGPGSIVFDRSMLDVGRGAIIGANVRMAAHLLQAVERTPPGGEGETMLRLGRIWIGEEALVGAQSMLAPGTSIDAGIATHAAIIVPPGSRLTAGGRLRPTGLVGR